MQNKSTPYGYCHCGCGRKTEIVTHTVNARGLKKGEPHRFVTGHNGWRTDIKLRERIGERYGRWTIVEPQRDARGRIAFLCKCECGSERVVTWTSLYTGHSKSCSCLRNEKASQRAKRGEVNWRTSHKAAKHPLYHTWNGMLQRCHNPNSPNYRQYGGRGIRVCDAWRADPHQFFADMGPRPEGMSIDRIDFNGNYEPSNCRWATPLEQARNRRKPNIEAGAPNRQRRQKHFRDVVAFLVEKGWPDCSTSGAELEVEYGARPFRRETRAA